MLTARTPSVVRCQPNEAFAPAASERAPRDLGRRVDRRADDGDVRLGPRVARAQPRGSGREARLRARTDEDLGAHRPVPIHAPPRVRYGARGRKSWRATQLVAGCEQSCGQACEAVVDTPVESLEHAMTSILVSTCPCPCPCPCPDLGLTHPRSTSSIVNARCVRVRAVPAVNGPERPYTRLRRGPRRTRVRADVAPFLA